MTEIQKSMTKNAIFLNEEVHQTYSEAAANNIFKMVPSAISSLLQRCAQFAKNSITRERMQRMQITGNLYEVKMLLEPDMVQAFILSGEKGVINLLMPCLARFFTDSTVSSEEKKEKVIQLRDDLKEAQRMADSEFDYELKKYNEAGVSCFKENVAEAIKPYKF